MKKKKRKPRKRIPMTFHEMRRHFKKVLPKGKRMASTFFVDAYCKGEAQDVYVGNDAPDVSANSEHELIETLTERFKWDNFEILKLLPIIRKRRQYFKDKEDAWAYDQRKREERSPFVDEVNDEFVYINPGGTKKMVKYNGPPKSK